MNNQASGGTNQGTSRETEALLDELWYEAHKEIGAIKSDEENWKIQTLPLARIKKIMKQEEFILQELEKDRLRADGITPTRKPNIKFMIAADAPVVVARACELLIRELTCRAWQHTEQNRRRTLQKQDVHAAVSESDVYDFLIDIVPRVATTTPAAAQRMNRPPPQRRQQQQSATAAAATHPDAVAAAAHVQAPSVSGIPTPQMDPNPHSQMVVGQQPLGGNDLYEQQPFIHLFQMHQQQQQQQQGVTETGEPENVVTQEVPFTG